MIELSGHASIRDVVAIADRAETVAVDPRSLEAVRNAHTAAADLGARVPTYGRTTGVGANRHTEVSEGDDGHGMRLLRSHAVDGGAPLPERTVRAMLAVRLNQLCVPGSGIDPGILGALERMLNDDALPTVLEFGSIGTGDLAALAGTALTLIGERPASRPLEPMPAWGVDSALPFMSSNALTMARACLGVSELATLERASNLVYLLSFLALDGNEEAFSEPAAAASANDSVSRVAARLRSTLSGIATEGRRAARIQDPYGLRVYAVTEGPLAGAISVLDGQLTGLINRAQENPLFDIATDAVIHHGTFFQAPLALAIDATTLAIAQTAPITHSRIRMMNEPDYTGASPFLAGGPAGASGLMMVEYVAAGAIAELRAAAQPASLGTLVLSRGVEDGASYASQGAVQLERAVGAYRVLLACELVGAMRLLRTKGVDAHASGILGDALGVASALSADDSDRDLRGDIALAGKLLDELGQLG